MFINKRNQLYKPKRALYYLEASKDEIAAFYKGEIPSEINNLKDAFGTYDYPGVFFIKGLENPVIGIEYRMNDSRVSYPQNLKMKELDEAFFYSVEIDEEIVVDRQFAKELFEEFAKDDDAHRVFSDLSIENDPSVISVHTECKKIRILHEWKLIEDRNKWVMEDNAEEFDKEYLYKVAFFDPITGHYNWNHLVSYLEMPMDNGIEDYAFVHFDIKEFKVINEVYGHIAANKVLSNVVKAMNNADFVYASARCHNDNFAMMIKDMSKEETVKTLRDFFESISHLEEDPNYKIFYRCGVVSMQHSLLLGNRVADAGKMAQALGVHQNETDIVIYTDKMHDDISWANYIKAYVDTAIEQDEFEVYLQPKFCLKGEKIKGAEALIRWRYKNKEFLPPSRFVPFFEKDGSIGKIDDVVLRKVCEALKKWKEEGKPLYPISVNLSRNRMYDYNLIEHLTSIVDEYEVEHKLIDFELTESATYDDTDHMIMILEELRKKGFRISLDDFGTGYSSLSLLTQMPIDTLKIDKSFVDKVSVESERVEDIFVIKHIINLASELGLECLAEGAEKREQVDRLGYLGCEIIQGYYFSKPIPIKEYDEKYLKIS